MADFQNNLPALHKVDATVVALSVDTREQALEIADLTGARYPMVYGLDAPEVGELIGAYVERERLFIHASSFILRPDGTLDLTFGGVGWVTHHSAAGGGAADCGAGIALDSTGRIFVTGESNGGEAPKTDEKVVDAEFEEVDKEKK